MTKFYGKVGYAENAVEDPNQAGVYKDVIVEKSYFGDVTRTTRQLGDGSQINSDLSTDTVISIVADAYANQNWMNIRYIEWANGKWFASNVTPQAPRLVITLGGVYHGPTA